MTFSPSSPSSSPFRAVALLDRDGTLVEDVPYLSDPAKLRLFPRATRALKLLREEGVACVVTTNQSGIGRGYFTEEDLARVHDRLRELFRAEGADWDALYFAPDHETAAEERYRANLHRRKPGPGMAQEAIRDLQLTGLPIFSIGDKLADAEFGVAAGGEGILVRTGDGAEIADESVVAKGLPLVRATDVYDAACVLLNRLALQRFPDDGLLAQKLHSPGELRRVVEALQRSGKRVVLANGCFDLLHGGHVSFLESARAHGDALVLAVNSNACIRRLKGAGRPLLDEPDRLQLLAALEVVDYLTVFHTDSADETLEVLRPDAHAKGTDYTGGTVPERGTSQRLGIETVIAGAPKENSTRDLIEVVLERARQGLL